MTSPEVSVVIVSYGTRDLTLAALGSLRTTEVAGGIEAVVVDNASPDDSAAAVAREHPGATLIRSPANRGFGAGANLGAKAARGEWLLFLNSDARLRRDTLPRLLEAARSRDRVGALGPRIEGPGGPERSAGHFFGPWRDFVQAFRLDALSRWSPAFEGVFIRRPPRRTAPVDWISGACMMIRRDLFRDLGGFDEAYFMYVEDMDLCYRLARAGHPNLYVPEAVVDHDRGRSPRPPSVLLEGGTNPEYFVRKSGIPYPLPLQRLLRVAGMARWLATLSLRSGWQRLTGRDDRETRRLAGLCRRSLGHLLRGGTASTAPAGRPEPRP